MQNELLNPALYRALERAFGPVRVDKRGQELVVQPSVYQGRPSYTIACYGETYCVRCPVCGDASKHLSISYAFGMPDPITGQKIAAAKCWRQHCSVVDLVRRAASHTNARRQFNQTISVTTAPVIQKYISPGVCVGLNQKDHPLVRNARQYLLDRPGCGIDPDRAFREYGLSVCIAGNPEIDWSNVLVGRLICWCIMDGKLVGWQGRLARNLEPGEKETFATLRYISMPGTWRQSSIFGLDRLPATDIVAVVEGPLDVVQVGAPAICTMGQTISTQQYDKIAERWGGKDDMIIVVGDSGEEVNINKNASELKRRSKGNVFAPKLPNGDPGSWERGAFWKFVREEVQSGRCEATGGQVLGQTSGTAGGSLTLNPLLAAQRRLSGQTL